MKKIIHFLVLVCTPIVVAQQQNTDFTHLQAELFVNPSQQSITGDLVFTFNVLQPTDSVFIDARAMEFHKVLLDGKPARYSNDQKRLILEEDLQVQDGYKLEVKYTAYPKQALYFIPVSSDGEAREFQVWTQGQGKYTSHWLPSFDDTREKLEFDLSILYPKDKAVAANGLLTESEEVYDSLVRWNFDMNRPMSSYLVAMAAGDFKKEKRVSKSGVPILLLYPDGRNDRVEPTYRYTEEILEFFEEEIGVPYPWQVYQQVPVRDFLYAGMENTSLTIFSDLFLVDSIGFNDRNYVMVNAHELAHQWFGNYVTAASGKDHWLQEGFATYYALLAEKKIFGDDYFYWKLFQSAEELKELSDSGKGESLQDPGASSLTFYQKGAWALHILKDLVGKEAFDSAVKNYLLNNAYGNVTTVKFISEIEKSSGKDLSEFRKNWIDQTAFQSTEAFESLKKSQFIRDYLEVAAHKNLPLEIKRSLFERVMRTPVNDYLGQQVVYQLSLEDPTVVSDLYLQAFKSDNLYVRQAIALSLQQIPRELKTQYESLLEDRSYITQEAALLHLWVNFPEDRTVYLQKMEGQNGFLDKNIRTLWLALNMATQEVDQAKKEACRAELSSYTAPSHRFQLRQNAFEYLYQLRAFESQNIHDLLEASRHHNYRFRGFAKDLLKKVLQMENLLPEDRSLLEEKLGLEGNESKS